MSIGLDHPAVTDYLARLDAASQHLPPGRRAELSGEIREHLADALAALGSDEAAVRGVLDRLGDPADIVAAETPAGAAAGPVSPYAATPTVGSPERRESLWGPIELTAVLSLTLGSVLVPVIGPLVGIACAWASPRWSRKEALVATALVLAPIVIAVVGLAAMVLAPRLLLASGADLFAPHLGVPSTASQGALR